MKMGDIYDQEGLDGGFHSDAVSDRIFRGMRTGTGPAGR